VFDADRPIISSAQDRLNRTLFSKYLARCMLDHHNLESLVIGLYGSWGVGKTSIINMVLEELNFASSNMLDEDKPIILSFSPWSYSGQNQLIYSFFRRLSSTLRNAGYLEKGSRIIHLLELYVSFFTHKPIPRSLRTKRNLLEKMTFQGREEIYAWESGRDLTLVKAELNELLAKQKHKIIIIIDNISRLYADEIKQIFQIVKSMGDYSNTAYLLSFDKEQVVRAINKVDGSGGYEFIEKIVQMPFEVPPILQHDLENIFADRLNEVLKTIPAGAWNNEYWADLYYSAIKFFFKNCRDITRYINTLNFSYVRVRDLVNPVDYFALTAIEVFLPEVYAGIRDNKDLFTDLLDNVYQLDADTLKKDKMRCDEILHRCTNFSKTDLLELLMDLFPRIRHIYEPNIAFYHSEGIARKLKRICSPDLFDLYFRLSMQPGQIPPSEFETILALSNDAEAFDHALTRLNQDERITKFLDQLDSKILKNISEKNIPSIINSLLDNGDLFPSGPEGLLNLNTPMRIYRIIHRLLARLTSEERFAVLQNAIASATKSIYITVHVLKELSREHLEEEDTFLPIEFRDLTPEQLKSLCQLAVNRIQHWAQSGRLSEHPKLFAILAAWRDWGNKEECETYIKEMVKQDRGIISFLIAGLNGAIDEAMTEYEKNPYWEKYLADIESLIPAKELEPHAKVLFEDEYFEKLREKEQLALMIFLDLTKSSTVKVIPKT
jgi:predicted KAP-like P-loop ATPase